MIQNKKKIIKTGCLVFIIWVAFFCGWGFSNENPVAEPVQPVEITTEVVPLGYRGDDYSTQFTARGGSGSYHFSTSSIPSPLTLSETGELTGKLSMEPGRYSISVTVADTRNPDLKASKEYTLNVFMPLFISTETLSPAVFGLPYRGKIMATGGSENRKIWVGHVPTGLTVDQEGNIAGIPKAKPGQYTIHAEVADASVDPDRHESRDYRFILYPSMELRNQALPPVLSPGTCNLKIEARGGSGHYAFLMKEPVKGLSLSSSGKLTGELDLKRGIYPLQVSIEDVKAHQLIEKTIDLKVIDFLPDTYEALKDNDFKTENVMKPGGKGQYHTFNEPGDRDVIRIDLTETARDTIIRFATEKATRVTPVTLTLYGPDMKPIQEKKGEPYPDLYYRCEKPGIYYAALSTLPGETGDVHVNVKIMGPGIRIKTHELPDVSRYRDVLCRMETTGGSGVFRFSVSGLPAGLAMNEDGRISGRPTVAEGDYPFKCRVTDNLHEGISDEREFLLHVVDFFPDVYESMGDNDLSTTNAMKPGDPVQEHTFNTKEDTDVIRLDLSGIGNSHVLCIATLPLSQPTRTRISLIKEGKIILEKTGDKNGTNALFIECGPLDTIFVKISEPENRTGEYAVKITDKGEKVRFKTSSVPDALTKGPYSCQITAEKGSGDYRFSAVNLPGKLTMDDRGAIRGDIQLPPGPIPFSITVTDLGHPGMSAKKEFVLTVVEYFPDIYEKNEDDDFGTKTVMKPGDEPQKHTFHKPGDVDMIRLDLRECKANDVILITSAKGNDQAEAVMTLYNIDQKMIAEDKRENRTKDLKIVFICVKPDIYVIKMVHAFGKPGEYVISSVNCGQKVELPAINPPMAESDIPYRTSLAAKGGFGTYTYRLSSGNLPGGVTLDPGSGTVLGKNTSWGRCVFSITAQDNRYPDNSDTKEYSMDAFMGRKISGTSLVEFPHYVSGTFSMDSRHSATTAFPGNIEGGTKGNLRYRIKNHTIPEDRFQMKFDPLTGELSIREARPISCDQYVNTTIHADIDVTDNLYPNNTFTIRYEIPVRCLTY